MNIKKAHAGNLSALHEPFSIQLYQPLIFFFCGANILALFNTTAKVAVLWITAAQSGVITPNAPISIAAELTVIVAMKF